MRGKHHNQAQNTTTPRVLGLSQTVLPWSLFLAWLLMKPDCGTSSIKTEYCNKLSGFVCVTDTALSIVSPKMHLRTLLSKRPFFRGQQRSTCSLVASFGRSFIVQRNSSLVGPSSGM